MRMLYIHHKNLLEFAANNIQVINMCKAFARNGQEIDLLLPYSGSKIDYFSKIEQEHKLSHLSINLLGFRMVRMRSITFSTIISLMLFFLNRRKIFFSSYNLIYTRHLITYLYFRRVAKHIVFEVHNNYFYKNTFLNTLAIKLCNNKFIKITSFVCISERLKEFWLNRLKSDSIYASHDGFDEQLFNNNLSQDDARRILNWDNNERIITYTGSIRPDREISQILEIAYRLPEYKFKLIGGPSEFLLPLKRNIKERGIDNVDLIGVVPHNSIFTFLRASDILLALWSDKVPTINYCSPLKIFEYMAAGRFILVHDYPTIREVFSDNIHGYLVKPNNKEDLLSKVQAAFKLTTQEKEFFTKNASENAFNNYTWTKRAQNILSFVSTNVDLDL